MPVQNQNLNSLGYKEPECEAALKQYEIELKNSYSLRLAMIEEKFSCLANNKLYSPKTETRKEYEKSEHIKEKLVDFIRLNISSSSKQDFGDHWQDIEERIKKSQVGNSNLLKTKRGKSKGVAKYDKLWQNETYNDDYYEDDSISVDDIDKWGSSDASFIPKNLSCETHAEKNIRNSVSKNVSHSRSESINKIKKKHGRPPKSDVVGHCSSESINKRKRKCDRPPKFDVVSHCSSESINIIKRKVDRPPKSDVDHCPTESINKIKRKLGRPPKSDVDHCPTESINKIKRKVDRPPKSDFLSHCPSESINKIKRKRGRTPKSDVSHRGVKKFKAHLGNSVEVFDSGLGSFDNTRNFIKINEDAQNVIGPKQAKSFNDDDTKIKENISKKKLKCISELGDKSGKHIKESTTENVKKNKRKRAYPSKSDVISHEKVNMAKAQLGYSDEIFYIEPVSDFNYTKGNIKRSKNVIDVVDTKQTKKPTKNPKRKNYWQKVSKKNHLMTDKNESCSFIQTIPDLNPDLKYSKCFGLDDSSLTIQSSHSLQNKKMLFVFPLYENTQTTTKSNEEAQGLSITLAQKQADNIQKEGFLNNCISRNPKNLSDDRNIENNLSKIDSEQIKAKQGQLIVKRTVKENIAKIALENEERSSDLCSETLRLGQKESSNECSSPKKSSALERKISANEYSNKKTTVALEQNLHREEISEHQKFENKFFKSLNLISVPEIEKQKRQRETPNKTILLKQIHQNNLTKSRVKESKKLSQHQNLRNKDAQLKNSQADLNNSADNLQNLEMTEREYSFLTLDNKQQGNTWSPKHNFECNESQTTPNTKTKNLKIKLIESNFSQEKVDSKTELLEKSNKIHMNALSASYLKNSFISKTSLATIEEEQSFPQIGSLEKAGNINNYQRKLCQEIPTYNLSSNFGSNIKNPVEKTIQNTDNLRNETEINGNLNNREEINVSSHANMTERKNSSLKLRLRPLRVEKLRNGTEINSSIDNKKEVMPDKKTNLKPQLKSSEDMRNRLEVNGDLDNREEINVSSHIYPEERKIRRLELRIKSSEENLKNGTERNRNLNNREKTTLSSHTSLEERKTHSLKLRLESSEENLKNGTERNRNLSNKEQTTISSDTSSEERKTRSLKLRLNSNRPIINSTLLPMKREEYEMSILASKSSLMKSISTLKETTSNESKQPLWHGSSKNENNKTVSAVSCERTPPISDDSHENLPIDFSSYTFLSLEDTKISKAKENILLGCSFSKFDRTMKSLLFVE